MHSMSFHLVVTIRLCIRRRDRRRDVGRRTTTTCAPDRQSRWSPALDLAPGCLALRGQGRINAVLKLFVGAMGASKLNAKFAAINASLKQSAGC